MIARLELQTAGKMQQLSLVFPTADGKGIRYHAKVSFEKDTKAIGHGLAELLLWMTKHADV